jgi:hypothetical protein
VPELATSSDSSDGAVEVDDGHLEESDLFDLYEAMHVPLPETRFSDNSGDESTAEPAPPPRRYHCLTTLPSVDEYFAASSL